MNFRETFRSARNIDISIRPSSKSVTRTSRCTSIGQALSVAQKQTDCAVAGFTDQHHFLTGIISELGDRESIAPTDRRKPNAHSRHCSIPKCSVELFRYSRSPKMSIRVASPLAGFKFATGPPGIKANIKRFGSRSPRW